MVSTERVDQEQREVARQSQGCLGALIALPFTLAVDTLRVMWRILSFPVRVYRRQISVQLIASHVLVVLLTAGLLGAAVLALAVGLMAHNMNVTYTDREVIDQGRVLSALITPQQVAQMEAGGADALAVDQTQEALQRVIASRESSTDETGTPADANDFAVVVDTERRVLAVSDARWAQPGQSLDTVASPLVVRITERAIELDGGNTAYGNPYVFDTEEELYAVAYPVLGDDGRPVAIVGLQRTSQPASFYVPIGTLVAALTVTGLIGLVLLTFPALLVSVPVGVWRARAVSKRLGHLAEAADAMAQGELGRRVEMGGQDEITRLGERFNAMAAGLEAADRARKAFVANVSHELRTPITIVQGRIERLIADERVADPPVIAEELEIIQGEVLTLSRLVDDLFTLARLEEAVLPVESQRVDLQAAAATAVESLRGPAWDQRRVTVQSVVPAEVPAVLADPTRLRQIFGNLLYNALRNTPEGGLIIVDARRDGDVVEVAVSDTGVGIAPDELDAIFKRFYRTEGGQRRGEGAGLGLAVVKQLVEAQGGTISVESQPGEGTTFRFTLPVAP